MHWRRLSASVSDGSPSSGAESPTAWIANTGRAARLFGYPGVTLDQLIDWTAHWLTDGLGSLDKPTHFEARSGKF